jgi:glycerophosphoryl diester phosphodiesterase
VNWPTLRGAPPDIIAHRGASGLMPEHTLAGYALALSQGADIIEPDLVPSRDGVLFARHEPGLARSTDIAMRPQFSNRLRDGDWQSIDLDADELDTLRAIQPFPGRSADEDRRHAIPRFEHILRWAGQAAAERGAPVLLYPEIKHPARLAALGHDPVPRFIESVSRPPTGVEVWVQCFEPEPLRRVSEATGLPCCLLLDADSDWQAAIERHGGWLFSLGVSKRLLIGEDGQPRDPPSRGVVELAHRAGLRVDVWTFRDDAVAPGFSSIEDELIAAMQLGVDGMFCDFPKTGLAARVRAGICSG